MTEIISVGILKIKHKSIICKIVKSCVVDPDHTLEMIFGIFLSKIRLKKLFEWKLKFLSYKSIF